MAGARFEPSTRWGRWLRGDEARDARIQAVVGRWAARLIGPYALVGAVLRPSELRVAIAVVALIISAIVVVEDVRVRRRARTGAVGRRLVAGDNEDTVQSHHIIGPGLDDADPGLASDPGSPS